MEVLSVCRLRLSPGPRLAPRADGLSQSVSVFLVGRQFSRNARPRPQVVITRIAVRHEHHLAPSLVGQRPHRRQGRARRRPPHPPAVNVEPPADDHGEDEKTEDLAGKMSTIWRPDLDRLRASIAEMEGSESEQEKEDATKKGVKRKRAPRTKGACEHGVKYRSQCKVCSACPHGKWRSRCKECGGSQVCEHGRRRSLKVRWAICVHGRQRHRCKECGGASICEHGRER